MHNEVGGATLEIALRPLDRGLVAHALHEERDLNSPKALFENVETNTDRDMVQLAKLLIDRQTGRYDPADVEDRYEARLRAIIHAKLKGQGLEADAVTSAPHGNVVDMMAALKRSLGQTEGKPPPAEKAGGHAGDKEPKRRATAAQATKPTRKRA